MFSLLLNDRRKLNDEHRLIILPRNTNILKSTIAEGFNQTNISSVFSTPLLFMYAKYECPLFIKRDANSFFIRDSIKFPRLLHSRETRPTLHMATMGHVGEISMHVLLGQRCKYKALQLWIRANFPFAQTARIDSLTHKNVGNERCTNGPAGLNADRARV